MKIATKINYINIACIFATFAFGLFLQGNIPGFSLATLGQTLVVAGYPISFIDSGTLYATHMGHPTPSPMSSLLAPSILMVFSNLIGFDPINSYILSFIIFYSIGFYGAYQLAKVLKIDTISSSLLVLLWMSFPIVWNSSGYSHLHFAFVIYPFLMYVAINSILYTTSKHKIPLKNKALLFLMPTLIIFTDGYAFMFYALSSSMVIVYRIFDRKGGVSGWNDPLQIIAIHFCSLLLAYLLYSQYVGITTYKASPIDFHRGWGVDLLYLILPTYGVHFFWDVFGLAQVRNPALHFGDASVWISSFMLPLIVATLIFFRKINTNLKWIALFIFIISIYMALGPSLKINAIRTVGESQMMSASQGLLATGNSFIYENVPGFKSMRATFRWVLVSFFALWLLLLTYIATNRSRKNPILILALVIMFLPDIRNHINSKINNYNSYEKIKTDLIEPLGSVLNPEQKIVFLPYRNDFMVNYIAPYLDIVTYNIGGDKNLELAKLSWPNKFDKFKMGQFHSSFAEDVLLLLLSEENIVDAVVIPHVDLLWAAHSWPRKEVDYVRRKDTISKIEKFDMLDIEFLEYFTIVKLQDNLTNNEKDRIRSEAAIKYCIENCYRINDFSFFDFTQNGVLKDGALISSGERGFLHFGPYSKFNKGIYSLSIEVQNCHIKSEGSFFDVVSNKGRKVHFKKLMLQTGSCNYIGKIKLEDNVDDLEVRVFANGDDMIILKSMQFTPMDLK